MSQTSTKYAILQAPYEPLKEQWVAWVRYVQLGFTVLVLALAAYATSQGIIGSGIGFVLFTTIWSVIYVALIIWGTRYTKAHHRPNFVVLGLEFLSFLWWLVSFGILASISTGQAFLTGVAGLAYVYKRSDASDLADALTSSLTGTTYKIPNWVGALNACKGATAVACFNWLLFTATLVAFGMKLRQLHKSQSQGHVQPVTTGSTGAQSFGEMDTDKIIHTGPHAV